MQEPLRDFVFIATADWHHPFWTNKQHIASKLAQRGHRVLYIESLGLRQVTAKGRDLKRIQQRVMRSFGGLTQPQKNIFVYSPLILPLHRFSTIRWANWKWLAITIRYFCKKLNFQNPIVWTYNPIITALIKQLHLPYLVYHCVDDLLEAPGMPTQLLQVEEKALCEMCNFVVTTSLPLYESRQHWNPATYYLSNPCDFEHFHQAVQGIPVSKKLEQIPTPRVGFIGALSNYKVDHELLKQVIETYPKYQFVFIGEIGEGDPNSSFEQFKKYQHVHFLGHQPYDQLPSFSAGFDVAMLPCPLNRYTRAMFPIKFFEYLAAGLPVVTTALPALKELKTYCYWSLTSQQFIENLRIALEKEDSVTKKIEQGIALAKKNTWENRLHTLLTLVSEKLS